MSFPVRPGPRGRRHRRRGRPAAPTARAAPPGSRVVLQPVLGCAARGSSRRARPARRARSATAGTSPSATSGRAADRVLRRHRRRVVDVGLVAHPSQLYAVPDGLSDEDAVTVEPVACAVHAVLGAPIERRRRRGRARRGHARPAGDGRPLATWRHGPLPVALGAPGGRALPAPAAAGPRARLHRGAPPDQLARAVRRHTRSLSYGGASGMTATLSGGADVVLDCVGSPESIAQSLAMVRPRGTVALVGMPGKVTVDLAPLWHREVRLAGAYAYGTESDGARRPVAGLGARARGRVSTFALASRARRRAAAPGGSSRPPIRSPASRRRWPTPAPRAGGAPSRSPSTYGGKDTPDEPPTRLRPRGGQVHATDLVLERRGLHRSRRCPRGAGSSTPPSRWSRSRTRTGPSATPCCTRSATATRCRRCCARA